VATVGGSWMLPNDAIAAKDWAKVTALTKQYKATIPYIESKTLSPFVQNKSIQKARESRRISEDTKKYLLQFKL